MYPDTMSSVAEQSAFHKESYSRQALVFEAVLPTDSWRFETFRQYALHH